MLTAKYQRLYNQIKELISDKGDVISHMSTINAVLFHKMKGFFWVGFYLLNNKNELIVGPYQGSLACIKLEKNTGVCWAAINKKETIIVDNVHNFEGHIACSSLTNSEIVVPVSDENNRIFAVLDIDSKELSRFSEEDKNGLEAIVNLLK